MRKSCCIDDANFTPRSSSCSMVLRSACTHGHPSHNSLAVKKSQLKEVKSLNKKFLEQSTDEKVSSCEKSLDIETYFQSSLRQFAFKSAKTYSVLKESIYNHFDYSNKLNYKSTNEKEALSASLNDLHNLSKSRELLVNNSIIQEECCHVNNNYITSINTMPSSRDFSRSSVAALNALSDSENEESLSKSTIKRRLSKRSSVSQSSTGKTESLSSNNNSYHNSVSSVNNVAHATYEATLKGSYIVGSNSSYHTPTSSILYGSNNNNSRGSDVSSTTASPSSPTVIDISNVQYTLVDRFRWFLWRSIYLKIITCVNFDVWLLTRSSNYRKAIVLLLLIPFLIYLLSGIGSKNFIPFDKLNSNAYDFSSSVYSFLSSPFAQRSTFSDLSSEEMSTHSNKAYELLIMTYNLIGSISYYMPWNYSPSHPKIKTSATNNQDHLKIMESDQEQKKHIDKDDTEYKRLISEVASLRLEVKSLSESFEKLEKSVSHKSEELTKYTNSILQNISVSSSSTVKSYDEKYIIAALKKMVERENDKNSPYYFFIEWLQTKLNSDKEVLLRLKFEFENIKTTCAKYDETVIENTVKKYIESLKKDLTSLNKIELSGGDDCSEKYLDVVRRLIREAILLYDADKTGKVDYALESGGGSVLSTRCSESYAEKDGTISVLGLPLWSTHSSPRTVIQPSMQPGQCWAFKGSQGFLVIQLSYTILVTGFTLEHIPLSLSPSGSIDSAPKDFSVWGLLSEKDNEGKLLGHYTFDQHGDSLQYFPVQKVSSEPFSYVELKILSNWGNLEYTCLYRFRVHGKQPKH